VRTLLTIYKIIYFTDCVVCKILFIFSNENLNKPNRIEHNYFGIVLNKKSLW